MHIENCLIYGFTLNGIQADQPTANSEVYIRNTNTYMVRSGLVVGQTVKATVDNFRSENNLYGVQGANSGKIHVRNSVLSGNTYHGIVTTGLAVALVENTTIGHNNDTGAIASGASARVRLSNTTITGNTTGLRVLSGGQIISSGNNYVAGNGTNGAPTSTPGPM